METNRTWLKFILSGSVYDYIEFVSTRKNELLKRGEISAYHNRRVSDKRDEYRRK